MKYRSEVTTQTNNNKFNKLDYLNDPIFENINRFFVLSFKNRNDDPKRDSFDELYMPLVEMKDFNAFIDNKTFFDLPIKKKEACEKLIKMSRNDDYTTGNLLNELSNQNCYKLIGIDLSRQTNPSNSQQINFAEKLEEDDGAIMFFTTEKQQKTIV